MTKLIVAVSSFLATLIVIVLVSQHSNSPTPPPEAAQIFPAVQQGQPIVVQKNAAATAVATSTPTPTTTPSPDLVPSILVTVTTTPIATATPSPTSTVILTQTQTPAPTPTLTATPTSTSASDHLVVSSLTSPIAQKKDATIKIKTDAGASCSIEVTLPSGTVSTSKDLAPKTADQQGDVIWTWGINWNTKPGTATIKLSCTGGGQTYSGQTTMQIIPSS